MATLTATRPQQQRSLLDPPGEERLPRRPAPRPPDPDPAAGSGPTLDDVISGAWKQLLITHAAACPVCRAELTPRFSSGPHPVAAACRACGSQLS